MNKNILAIVMAVFCASVCGKCDNNTTKSVSINSKELRDLKDKMSYIIEKSYKKLKEEVDHYDKNHSNENLDDFNKKELKVNFDDEINEIKKERNSKFAKIAKELVEKRVTPSDIVDFYCKEDFKYGKKYCSIDKEIKKEEQEKIKKMLELYAQSLG
jgi:hypothetical protein